MNMARGVQKSDYNQGKEVLDRPVSYKGYAIQCLFSECDGQRNVSPTSTLPRLGSML